MSSRLFGETLVPNIPMWQAGYAESAPPKTCHIGWIAQALAYPPSHNPAHRITHLVWREHCLSNFVCNCLQLKTHLALRCRVELISKMSI